MSVGVGSISVWLAVCLYLCIRGLGINSSQGDAVRMSVRSKQEGTSEWTDEREVCMNERMNSQQTSE